MPHHIGLRVAVQEQQRWTIASGACEDFPDGGIDPVRGKSGKEVGEIRHGLLATAIGGYDNNLLLPLDCAPADIAAAEAVRPADAVDRCIGAALCFAHGLGAR